jgi:hypothetical protein
MLGKIYLILRQSAGNLSFSTKTTVSTKNTYNNYINLPIISEHVPKHKFKITKFKITDTDFGYFLAGLIEGNGWFDKKELHIILTEYDISLAYFVKK